MSTANQMTLKANELKIENEQWEDLVKIIASYKVVAKRYGTQNLLKTMAKDYHFLALLCHLAYDDKIGCDQYFKQCEIEAANFMGSREHELIGNLIACINEDNLNNDTFIEHIVAYKQYSQPNYARECLYRKIQEIYCVPEKNVDDPKPSVPVDDDSDDLL